MFQLFSKLISSTAGNAALEYGIIASIMAVMIVMGVTTLGTSSSTTFARGASVFDSD